MKIKENWWKNFFGGTYLLTDARTVCDRRLTRREADLIEKILKPAKSDRLLDFCGGYGRHSLELARRGYRDLTVIDFSEYMIKLGKNLSENEGLVVKFLRRDARRCGLEKGVFDCAFIMANSFGYFPRDSENLKILREARKLLRKGGRLLLDLSDSGYVRNNLKPVSWHRATEDVTVCRKRQLKGGTLKAREIVMSTRKGLIKDGTYCERIYDKKRLKKLLKSAGFKNFCVKSGINLRKGSADYGLMSSRMLVTAAKP